MNNEVEILDEVKSFMDFLDTKPDRTILLERIEKLSYPVPCLAAVSVLRNGELEISKNFMKQIEQYLSYMLHIESCSMCHVIGPANCTEGKTMRESIDNVPVVL